SFELTDEQKALRELAHEFAEREIRPRAAEYDEHSTHPADVIAKAHELGLMNLHVPEAYGGAGLSCFDGMLVNEELNWGCSRICILAMTDPSAHRQQVLSACLVPTKRHGVIHQKHPHKKRQRSTDTSTITFQDVAVPVANRSGEEGEGFEIAMTVLDFTRPGT